MRRLATSALLLALATLATGALAERFGFGALRVERVTDEGVLCLGRNALQTTLSWNEIERVSAVTVDARSPAEDLYWVVSGPRAECHRAHRDDPGLAMLEAVADRLPGFRWPAVIRALQNHGEGEFVAWRPEDRPK